MRVAVGVAMAVLALALAVPAHAQISIVDGKTAPVFDYDNAIREHVYIPNGQDADLDGVEDRTSIEIMRPAVDFKVPAIVAPSPYYTADCGQFVGELQQQGELVLTLHVLEVRYHFGQRGRHAHGASPGSSPTATGTRTALPHSVHEPS